MQGKGLLLGFGIVMALGFLFAAQAQEINFNFNASGGQTGSKTPPQDEASPANDTSSGSTTAGNFSLNYSKHPEKKTQIKILAPSGAKGKVLKGDTIAMEDEIPFTFNAQADQFYKIQVLCAGGVWDKKIEARSGQVASLEVNCAGGGPAPSNPGNANIDVKVTIKDDTDNDRNRHDGHHDGRDRDRDRDRDRHSVGMPEGDFQRLVEAIRGESFEESKFNILKDAVGSRYFTCDQVGRLLDLFDFENTKVEAAVLLYPRVADKDNFFSVYKHFEFDASKDEVRKKIGK